MDNVLSALQRFGIGRLAAIIGVSAGVAAALFALVLNVGSEPKALLYANLDLKEASSITQALDQAGIKYDAKGDGSTIMVPRDKVAAARLMLSTKGLPTSGSVGYEIFDNQSALGQTDFVQNLNMKRATEGELARTIKSLDGVTFARVQLVLPKRQLFEDEPEQPSASVVIGTAGRDPSSDQVRALQNLVAGAVPNLKPERVTIVDQNSRLLGGGVGSANATQAGDEARSATEDRIRKRIKELVEGMVGPGKARVQVTADLDLSQVTVSEEKFDPDGQVVRSTQTSEENSKEAQADTGNGQASTTSNIPGAPPPPGPGATSGNTAGKTEETTNYEISKTTRTEIKQPGTIKRLSVAVAVDGITAPGDHGKPGPYTPRSAQEMQRIEQLVRSAVGFDQTRGDQISVINVRFDRDATGDGVEATKGKFDLGQADVMRGGELLVALLMAALIIFFVVRPLLKTAAGGGYPGAPQLAHAGGGGGGGGALAGPGGGMAAQLGYEGGEDQLSLPGPMQADAEQRINIARIEGQVRASSVKQVAEFVNKHPEESTAILRSWLHEAT